MITPHQRNLVVMISFAIIFIALVVHTIDERFIPEYKTVNIEPGHVSGDLIISVHVTEGDLKLDTLISPSGEEVQPAIVASGGFIEYRITNAEPGIWQMRYVEQIPLTFTYYAY